jgi:hypothetical protein
LNGLAQGSVQNGVNELPKAIRNSVVSEIAVKPLNCHRIDSCEPLRPDSRNDVTPDYALVICERCGANRRSSRVLNPSIEVLLNRKPTRLGHTIGIPPHLGELLDNVTPELSVDGPSLTGREQQLRTPEAIRAAINSSLAICASLSVSHELLHRRVRASI